MKPKPPKAPPPGPLPDGTPYCPHCKAHHKPAVDKADWQARGLKCPNPFPKTTAERAAEKAAKKKPRTPGELDRAMEGKGRLPAGSRVFALWDGTTLRVELAIAGGDDTHTATGSGLLRTIVAADDLYRASLTGT